MVPWPAVMALVAGLLLGAGCGTFERGAPDADAPSRGMTKREIAARFGETNDRRLTESGETWVYRVDQPGFVPWNRGFQPRTRQIHFDRAGKVIGWDFD